MNLHFYSNVANVRNVVHFYRDLLFPRTKYMSIVGQTATVAAKSIAETGDFSSRVINRDALWCEAKLCVQPT